MYRKKNQKMQVEEVKIRLEAPVPEKHILRATDKATDFNFICEEAAGLYSDKERPVIDPVSLFKIVFIQYLFGIHSIELEEKSKQKTRLRLFRNGLCLQAETTAVVRKIFTPRPGGASPSSESYRRGNFPRRLRAEPSRGAACVFP